MRKTLYIGITAAALFSPFFAHAATLHAAFCVIGELVGRATPIVAGLALLAFFWGLTMYLFSLSGGEGTAAHSAYGMPATPQNKQQGKTIMIYGIIVLFVMLPVWGLVRILQATFDLEGSQSINRPTISGVTPPNLTVPACPGS